jgi:hypothetical protein
MSSFGRKGEPMSTSGKSLRKKRDRARDRRQQSRFLPDRADELIVGDGICGPRRSGFIIQVGEGPLIEAAGKPG